MTRKIPLLLLLGALLVPRAGDAQNTSANSPRPSRNGATAEGSVESEVFLSALRAIGRLHMDAYSDSTLWARALDGLIQELDDPYAAVFTPDEVEEFEEETTGNYAGIGVQISPLNDGVTITAVFHGTPAQQAGIVVGDVIVGVNGVDASDWTTQQASETIRGPKGTDVEVAIRRQGFPQPIPFRITRDEVHISAVRFGTLDSGVGYIGLDRVTRGSAQEVDSALRVLRGAKGIVFDLRRNPGGYLDESLMLADLFLPRGARLASTRSRAPGAPNVDEDSWNGRIPARVDDKPIIILVDAYTASAAEIVTGALQDHDRALVLGDRTFGKGVVQTVMDLPYGRKLRLTTGSWHTPLGRSLHRPRDRTGRPLEENLDTIGRVETPSGRALLSAGGIFPDLEVGDDTLRTLEREFLATAAELNVPLGVREAELAFAQAQKRTQEGTGPSVDADAFEAFVDALEEAGLPARLADDPVVRSYLDWRTRIAVAQRMTEVGAEMETRQERDPVLAEALRLLSAADSQQELFAAVRGPAPPSRPGSR